MSVKRHLISAILSIVCVFVCLFVCFCLSVCPSVFLSFSASSHSVCALSPLNICTADKAGVEKVLHAGAVVVDGYRPEYL